MKTLIIILLTAATVHAFDHSQNPDRYTSIGMDISAGKIPGALKDTLELDSIPGVRVPHTDGGFVKGLLDVRVPVTNTLTIHAFGSSTSINNNLQYSDGSEVGVGIRVFIR